MAGEWPLMIEQVSATNSHAGVQGVYKHASTSTGTEMTFSVFVPGHAPEASLPVVWYLSGLTCTHANVTEKGEYRRACAELGLIFVAPDRTSVVSGKSVSVRVALGGRRTIKKKNKSIPRYP